MPNELAKCLGDTGKMVTRFSQSYVSTHLYTTKGACLSICCKFMVELVHTNLPTKSECLEFAQWVQAESGRMERVNLAAAAAGLRQTATYDGQHLTDEVYLGNFVQQSTAVPSFVLFNFLNTQRTKGHALLLMTMDGTHWNLLDPNYGIAVWPYSGGALLGLKRLLKRAYDDFGPYYRFTVYRYQK